MSNDKYYDQVLAFITEHGETGVNVLANALNIPLSTMQRYLERQTYFRKTINRKWDLPSNVESDIKSNTMSLMVNSVENALKLVDSQMAELQLNIQNALMPVNTLKRAVDTINTPVAGNSTLNNPLLLKMDKGIKDAYDVFKKYIKVIPEEYQDLIKNVDMYKLSTELGTKYVNGTFNEEMSALMLEKITELSDETIDILSEYQKDDK